MKTNLKYLFKGLAWGAGTLSLLYLAIVLYTTLNKTSIINSVSQNLSEKLRGNVEIGKSELSFFRSFPNVAVLLKDVRISDSLFPKHKKYSFTGKEVFFHVSIPRLLKKQSPVSAIELKHASVNFFTHLDGYTNTYLLKPREGNAKGHTNPKNYLRKIILDQVSINFSDSIKGKFHNIIADHLSVNLKSEDSHISGDCEMKLSVQRIVFNPFKGAYLKNKSVVADFP
ncbi:MAG: hypothetical protein EOO07_39410, partial [Chitinophagaceae bacterium]